MSGATAALSADRISPAAIGLFAALLAVSAILVIAAWTLQPLEASLPNLARKPKWKFFPLWRNGFLAEYADDWASFLDGRATSLPKYKQYRSAWLGALSDIDRLLEHEDQLSRQKKLTAYRKLAKERLEEDTANVSLTLKRGIARRTRRRSQLAMSLSHSSAVCGRRHRIHHLHRRCRRAARHHEPEGVTGGAQGGTILHPHRAGNWIRLHLRVVA